MEIKITKTGLMARQHEESVDGASGVVKVDSIIEILRFPCVVADDVTLRDLLNVVEADETLSAFLQFYSWCPVQPLHAEVNAPFNGECPLHHVELIKRVEARDGHLRQWTEFQAVGPECEHGNGIYSLSFCPLNTLAHLQVKLNPMTELICDGKVLAHVTSAFTLLDVLDGIYFDIGYYGTPETRDKKLEQLRAQQEDTDDMEMVEFDLPCQPVANNPDGDFHEYAGRISEGSKKVN